MSDDLSQAIIGVLPRLRVFARGLTGSIPDADDLVQATCERALAARASFTAGTRLDSWLFRIMRNHFIDDYRRQRRVVPISDSAIEERLEGEDGRRTTEARLAMSEIADLIAAMPREHREVLLLVCVEGLRYREAAEVLDVPVGTVMSRLARARQALIAATSTEASAPEAETGS